MGCRSPRERATISETRRAETIRAYGALGVPETNIHYLGFPDASLWRYIGRRAREAGDSVDHVVAGHTGLENSLTWLLRLLKPMVVFMPSRKDIHPDHMAVSLELPISIFHASSDIWEELGWKIERPALWEWPTYNVAPKRKPAVGIFADRDLFERKLAAIACWQSQAEIIAALIASLRSNGPWEFLWKHKVNAYNPLVCARALRSRR